VGYQTPTESLERPRSTVALAAAGLSLIAVCYGLARFAYGLFVPVLRAEFGLDAAIAGAIASSSYVGYCVAIVLATLATSRWGARPVAVSAGVTAAVGTGLIAAAPNVGILATGVVIAGSSTGLASPPLADAVARWVSSERADGVQTVINAGTGLGVMVSGPVALLTTQNWRLAWWAFAAAAAAVTVWTAFAVPRHPGDGPRRAPREPRRRASWWPAGAPRLLAAAGIMGLASSAVWTFGRDLVATAGGVGPLASTVMWIVLGSAGLLGAFTGALVGRVGLALAWTVAMLALAVATAGLALGASSYPAVFAAAATFGAVYIALTGVLLVWGTRVYPDRPAFGVGAAFLLIAVGQAVGSPLVGVLTDLTTAVGAFLAAAATAAAGALVRPTRTGADRERFS
jgi:predicted MFS family arabinose efflux permease